MDPWFGIITKEGDLPADAAGALADKGYVVMPGPVPPSALASLIMAYDREMVEAAETSERLAAPPPASSTSSTGTLRST